MAPAFKLAREGGVIEKIVAEPGPNATSAFALRACACAEPVFVTLIMTVKRLPTHIVVGDSAMSEAFKAAAPLGVDVWVAVCDAVAVGVGVGVQFWFKTLAVFEDIVLDVMVTPVSQV